MVHRGIVPHRQIAICGTIRNFAKSESKSYWTILPRHCGPGFTTGPVLLHDCCSLMTVTRNTLRGRSSICDSQNLIPRGVPYKQSARG